MRLTRRPSLAPAARAVGLGLILPALAIAVATPVAAQSSAATPNPRATPVEQRPETRVALVTRPGRIDDAGINAALKAGALTGTHAIGAKEPKIIVPKNADDAATAISGLSEGGFNIVVTAPGLDAATAAAAIADPGVTFIGVDQLPPCLTPEGQLDDSGTCGGDVAALIPNLTLLSYREDQAGYLAGIVAASVAKNDRVGAIGGAPTCAACVRYIQGFEQGARSVNPDIDFSLAFVTDTDEDVAVNDRATGETFARAFIDVYQPDAVLQVGGDTGRGVLDAACKAGLLGVGVDVDQALSYPREAKCIITSATKSFATSVAQSIIDAATGVPMKSASVWDATNGGIGNAPSHELENLLPSDVSTRIADAIVGMQGGTVTTCPENCGTIS